VLKAPLQQGNYLAYHRSRLFPKHKKKIVTVHGFRVQRRLWPPKRPVWSKKRLQRCGVTYERFKVQRL